MRYVVAIFLAAAILLAGNMGAALAGRGDGSEAPAADLKVSVGASGPALFGGAEPVRADRPAVVSSGTDAENLHNLAR